MRSRKEIQRRVIEGLDQSFDRSADLTLYLRACERLILESKSAQAEGDNEQAYFVILRLVELVLNYLPRHPQAKDPRYAAGMKKMTRTVSRLMLELDVIKANLDLDYERYQRKKASDLEAETKQAAALHAKRREIEAALEMRDKEIRRAQERVMQSGRADLQRKFKALQLTTTSEPDEVLHTPARAQKSYEYPTIERSKAGPEIPPKVPDVLPGPDPPVPASSEYQFLSTTSLENGDPLKTVFLPASLRTTFLKLAERNTEKNLETCGILSGVLKNNAYFITTLIIPAQESTSDTCHTTDEEALFEYQDTNELFTIGWCHTHPSQTCFLSSVDLHTHCSYQLMLPESIALVYAPSKDPDRGCFRLTHPPGLDLIRACRKTGLFHPHETNASIYCDAASSSNHGHVKELEGMTFTIVDQRS